MVTKWRRREHILTLQHYQTLEGTTLDHSGSLLTVPLIVTAEDTCQLKVPCKESACVEQRLVIPALEAQCAKAGSEYNGSCKEEGLGLRLGQHHASCILSIPVVPAAGRERDSLVQRQLPP